MRPVMEVLADGEAHTSENIRSALIRMFNLSEADVSGRLRNGTTVVTNRVAWALVYLSKAGLVERKTRGVYVITAPGAQVLRDNPEGDEPKALRHVLEIAASAKSAPSKPTDAPGYDRALALGTSTPDEAMAQAYERLRGAVADDLMSRVVAGTPRFFEDLVLDVLTGMGYGGSRAEAARHLGRGGDEGVDGVIHEDRLGLDMIYVQAKRWARGRSVGRPDVQAFVGALQGHRATKGVLLTTARFTQEAQRYAATVTPRVVLVDGPLLADLMIEYGVGISFRETYRIPRVDLDYFFDEPL